MNKKLITAAIVFSLLLIISSCQRDRNNKIPVADAGADQTILIGDVVTLDGSNSYDPEASNLTYTWSVTSPSGILAQLTNSSTASPSFIAEELDKYIVSLRVTDESGNNSILSLCAIYVTAETNPPVANAGEDQTKAQGDIVQLDGKQSYDPAHYQLTYYWYWDANEIPEGSSPIIDNDASSTPLLTAGTPGTYKIHLTVSNDILSADDEVMITIETLQVSGIGPVGADIPVYSIISWHCNATNAFYDLYLATSANFSTPIATDIAYKNYNPGMLDYGIKYFCKVIAKNGQFQSESAVWEFTTSNTANLQWELLGLGNDFIRCMAITASNPDIMYAGVRGKGISRTKDGGSTWENLISLNQFSNAYLIQESTYQNSELYNEYFNFVEEDVYGIIVNQLDPNMLYIATMGQGVLKSYDMGDSWVDTNFPKPYVSSIAFYPYDASGNTIIAATLIDGIYKTIDGGANWYNVHPDSGSFACSIALTSDGAIYVATGNYGVLKSTDSGETWVECNNGLGNLAIWSITHLDDNSLLCGVEGNGVYYSSDGQNWEMKNYGMPLDYPITTILKSANAVYCGIFANGVFQSTDLGENWFEFNDNLLSLNIWMLKNDSSYLYAATSAGIWRIIAQ